MKYIVIDTPLLVNLDQSHLLSAKISTRKSLDGLKSVVKIKGDTPEILESFPQYTQDEAVELMETEAWASVDEEVFSDI